ncbi:MAG: PilN domain-containing protein [Armatimonadota bacterium]
MPSVNMIASRGAERKRLEKLVCITLLVILSEIVIALFVLGFMTTRVYTANREIGELDRKLAKIKPTVDKIHSYEAEISRLQPRLTLLANSREQTLVWYSLLQDLAQSMPANTWLSAMSTTHSTVSSNTTGSQPAPSLTVNLRGVSTSQALIGETMLRLGQFSEFERVDLDYTQNSPGRAAECVEFQLTAKMKAQPTVKGGA